MNEKKIQDILTKLLQESKDLKTFLQGAKESGLTPQQSVPAGYTKFKPLLATMIQTIIMVWQSSCLASCITEALRGCVGSDNQPAYACVDMVSETFKEMSSLKPPNCYFLSVHEGTRAPYFNPNLYATDTRGNKVTSLKKGESYTLHIKVKNNTSIDQKVTALFYTYHSVQTTFSRATMQYIVAVTEGEVKKNSITELKAEELFNVVRDGTCVYCVVSSAECQGPLVYPQFRQWQSNRCQVAQYNFSVISISEKGESIVHSFESHLVGEGENTLRVSREPLHDIAGYFDIPTKEMTLPDGFGIEVAGLAGNNPAKKMLLSQKKHENQLVIKTPPHPEKDSAALFVVKHFDNRQELVGSILLLLQTSAL